jgi:hypothetical protein
MNTDANNISNWKAGGKTQVVERLPNKALALICLLPLCELFFKEKWKGIFFQKSCS